MRDRHKHVYHNCEGCGKVRLVLVRKGQPASKLCLSCARKKPQYYNIKDKYEVGDTLNGSLCNRNPLHTYAFRKCSDCETTQWVNVRRNLEEWRCRKCVAKRIWYKNPLNGLDMSGNKHPFWKGGRFVNYFGYVQYRPKDDDPLRMMCAVNGYVLEHRYVMAKHLGRMLEDWEIVHHKNGIKDDNRFENLELSMQGAHSTMHNKGYQDGFNKGYYDGANKRINELNARIKQLEGDNNVQVEQEGFEGRK